MSPLITVTNLCIGFTKSTAKKTYTDYLPIINNVSFCINHGECIGLVGASGSGKSQIALSLLGLNSPKAKVSGSIKLLTTTTTTTNNNNNHISHVQSGIMNNYELVGLSNKEFNKFRGSKIAIAFQDSLSALNPYLPIKIQLIEALMVHKRMSASSALQEALHILTLVGIKDAKQRINDYPHQFSGGMRQRVILAMAISCKPLLLVADEPTTALDSDTQKQIIKLLEDLHNEYNMAILLISHDHSLINDFCDRTLRLQNGSIVYD